MKQNEMMEDWDSDEIGGKEMITLEKIQGEIGEELALGLVDEDKCLEIIAMGNMLKGYGLWLARSEVYHDDDGGFKGFCERAGVSRSIAYDSIAFYEAKMSAFADRLPTREGVFRALKGTSDEEKAELYSEVKLLSGKEKPTGQDVEIVVKTRSCLKASHDKQNTVIESAMKQTPAVRREFLKTLGNRGVMVAVEMMDSNSSEDDIVAELQGKKDKAKLSPTEKANVNKSTMEKNERLEKEIKQLKEENRKLKSMVKMSEITGELMDFIKNVYHSYRFITEGKKANEKLFKTRLLPHIAGALETLEMSLTIEADLDELKKSYKKMAKKHHPDKGGSQDAFIEIKKAYDTLKKYIK